MDDQEFLLIRDLIYDYCGIFLPESVKFIMERRLRPRLPVNHVGSYREYYRLVRHGRNGAREMEELVDRITTNETYFFRGAAQLRAFTDELLPAVVDGRNTGDTIRIWCAGCSSGEEPYTLSMLIKERPNFGGYEFDIFGHDISRKVLRLAREGLYRQASFRETAADYQTRYFEIDGKLRRLSDEIRNSVTFGHLNLMDESAMATIGLVDIVFCRNVMIYFSAESRRKLLESFLRHMRPGGYLLLGHSESLINDSTGFEIVPLTNDIVYRKPEGTTPHG